MSSIKLLRRIAGVLMLLTVGAVSVLGDGLPGEYVLTQRWRNMIADRFGHANRSTAAAGFR